MPSPKRSERPRRIRIAKPAPVLDNGRYAVKRTVGDTVAVSADIFRDGHEKMKAVVKYKAPGERRWLETEMHAVDAHISGVRWAGEFSVETPGSWQWTVEAWTDRWATWHDELRRKVAADLDEDLTSELSEGVIFLKRAQQKAKGDAKGSIEWAIGVLESEADIDHKFDVALGPELFQAMEETQEREGACALEKPITVEVDRVRARFSACSLRSAS
jgi:starch synthase (maltosyl-transferring)